MKHWRCTMSSKITGQQRLTTLTILFSVLVSNLTGKARESYNALLQESGNILAGIPARPRIHLRQRDQAFLINTFRKCRFHL